MKNKQAYLKGSSTVPIFLGPRKMRPDRHSVIKCISGKLPETRLKCWCGQVLKINWGYSGERYRLECPTYKTSAPPRCLQCGVLNSYPVCEVCAGTDLGEQA